MHIKIKKGLDINLQGVAAKPQSVSGLAQVMPELVAVYPDDFPGFVPKVSVKEGDTVKPAIPCCFTN